MLHCVTVLAAEHEQPASFLASAGCLAALELSGVVGAHRQQRGDGEKSASGQDAIHEWERGEPPPYCRTEQAAGNGEPVSLTSLGAYLRR